MRLRTLPLIVAAAVLLALAAPAAALAAFPHTVTPGESLSSIAATDGLSVAQLAAANGLSSSSQLMEGSTLMIPPQTSSAVSAPSAGVSASSTPVSTGTVATSTSSTPVSTGTVASSSSGVSSGSGNYLVVPGDTLSEIAARNGTTVAQLAVANGLDPNGILYAGSVLRLAGGGSSAVPVSSTESTASAEGQPVGVVAEGNPSAPPYPTPERVSGSQISQIASANGVSPSLAEAVGWQESGWNNALVSTADARGVMQILPGTWDWIQRSLTAGSPLAPASAADNVRGGVLLLHSLLNSTGGSPELAAAGYYQGLSSVQRYGMFPDTQRYVQDVMALRSRFGGG